MYLLHANQPSVKNLYCHYCKTVLIFLLKAHVHCITLSSVRELKISHNELFPNDHNSTYFISSSISERVGHMLRYRSFIIFFIWSLCLIISTCLSCTISEFTDIPIFSCYHNLMQLNLMWQFNFTFNRILVSICILLIFDGSPHSSVFLLVELWQSHSFLRFLEIITALLWSKGFF